MLRRLVAYLVGSVMDCFRPVIDFAVPPSHPDLHTAAVAAFMMSTCALQHYALHFLAEARANIPQWAYFRGCSPSLFAQSCCCWVQMTLSTRKV